MNQVQKEGEQEVRGVITRITYRNPENNYSIIQLSSERSPEGLTVVGTCLNAKVGTHLIVRGEFKTHPKFGKQLQANSMVTIEPSSAEGIKEYLASGLIPGIGPKTADLMVDVFGADTLKVIYQEPQRLGAIKGIGPKKARLIAAAVSEQQELGETMRFLHEHKIGGKLASRIYEKYGKRSVEVLKQDPYLPARQIRGIGFATADDMAMKLGLKPDSPQRLTAGLYYALEKAGDDGHCYLPREELIKRAQFLLGLEEAHDLDPFIESLIRDEFIVNVDDKLFLRYLARAEEFVARFVAARCHEEITPPLVPIKSVAACLVKTSAELEITFSADQSHSVELATKRRLMIITGGPGCGKTTIIRAISSLFETAGKKLLLAAPTGRAAQRMAQVCGMPASTIHRMLRYDPRKHSFLHGPTQPLVADAIIVDEASMLDISLARDLFSAIARDTTLILVGDKDQLPSVGPGRVFSDLIGCGEIDTISLSQLFRREESSTINSIAHMINAGVVPPIPEPDGQTKVDAYFIKKSDTDEAATTIENLVADQLPRKFGFDISQIMVLTPSNRGDLGTITLNKRLQQRINPPTEGIHAQELVVNDLTLRVGDRVCQRVNNYNLDEYGVFNGDTGQVYSIDKKKRSMVVEMWDGRLITYEHGDLPQLSLAYAITVHRAQGSEIPCVVLALHKSHFNLLERQLIYTAITRAKKLLVIVGLPWALRIACQKTTTSKRCTMLIDRIMREIAG